MGNLSKITAGVLGVIGVVALMTLILAIPIQWLWNNFLVGAIDGVNEIGLFQAFAINVLTSILFNTTTYNKTK